MGEVYRAFDPRLRRDVAIKVIPAAFATDAERLRRFEQEARAAAALNHPNILTVHDIDNHEGAPYIVSERLEGETLRERLALEAVAGKSRADSYLFLRRAVYASAQRPVPRRRREVGSGTTVPVGTTAPVSRSPRKPAAVEVG